jgi:hypothetical protein
MPVNNYDIKIYRFSDGATTFEVSADPDARPGVFIKDGTADAPRVVTHIVENDAGAIVDLDGTGPATLVPPEITMNFIFIAAHPAAQAQYANLVALTGKHGTLTGKIPGPTDSQLVTAPARLISVKGKIDGAHRVATENWLPVTAVWQLKGFWS